MATPLDPNQGSAPVQPAKTVTGLQDALADRSKFIRTMAKDMAALAGTPAPAKEKPTSDPKREETFNGVTLAKEEQPFFERPQSRAEREAETLVPLPSLEEASAIVDTPAAPAPVKEAERTAILERLRQKVGESAQMSIQNTPAPLTTPAPAPEPKAWPDIPAPPPSFAAAPEPAPVVPPPPPPAPEPPAPAVSVAQPTVATWGNIPAPTPQFAPLAEPTPPRMPQVSKETYREPIEAVPPARPLGPSTAGAMHTYTTDFADRIDARGASAFSVLAAEQDAQMRAPQTLRAPRRSFAKTVLPIVTGVVLLALAGGGIFATYQFVMTMRNTPIAALTVPSIVFADEYRELEGTGSALMASLAASANGSLVQGNVLVTYILTATNDESGAIVRVPAGGDALVRALQVPAPDILLRNIAEESTVGVVNAGGETRAFFVLRVDSYERTYAGMLTWEPLMARDLALLYPGYPAPALPELSLDPATSTASTTLTSTSSLPVFTSEPQARTRFEDAIVANHDVRILRDTSGQSLMLYGYADKQTLIIARNEAAFEALLARLKSE